ncbi:P2Y purinoceptor 2-like isoform X1 [Gadus macrocephalus]|uniref:P2Y purinoceptor 2-like isoform X1 n=1 Tax=Gadus macrocephalus TaxID=80720 RepID=UPI0028CB3F1C|nr:P2Y purinoceptor 2-like isoform X1 [Gadus macrocephalus]XP_059930916.1 P2Y purinoceptor 2-like isoform X1 [Gadus macrocephalus]
MNFSHQSAVLNVTSLYSCRFKEDFKYLLLPISYSLVFFFGLSLNAMALFVITFRTKRWTPSTVYMLNLTVCDTLYIFTLPFLIYYYADANDWPFGEPVCKIIRFLFYANLYGSILFLSAISLHRFIGICYPVRSLSWLSVKRAKLVSVGVWACVLSCQAPVLYFSRTRRYGKGLVCFDTTGPELFDDFLVYSSVISVVMFVLPFMLVMVCYGLMVRKLLEPSWGSGEGQQGLRAAHRTKQKSVKMIIIVLMTFMFCFLPFHLTRSLYYSFRYLRNRHPEQITCKLLEASSIAYKVTRPLASANSLIDPFLFFMAGQDFRKTMKGKKQKKAANGLPKCANTALTTSL